MVRAVDVAEYILTEKGRLTGYQLQKLLYYCQAWCLVVRNEPLYPEEVCAWEHGPVVYEVARQHRGMRSVASSDISGDLSRLSDEDRLLIDSVLEAYANLSGDELEALSHTEAPWKDAYNGVSGFGSNPIPREAMQSYYSGLMSGDSEVAARHHVPHFAAAPRIVVSDADFKWLESVL